MGLSRLTTSIIRYRSRDCDRSGGGGGFGRKLRFTHLAS